MTLGSTWLESRLGGVPDPLADRIRRALGPEGGDGCASAYAVAGVRILTSARASARRSAAAAFDLLAADALITLACEAAMTDDEPMATLESILADVAETLP